MISGNRWAKKYERCMECFSTKYRHYSHGLCIRCRERHRVRSPQYQERRKLKIRLYQRQKSLQKEVRVRNRAKSIFKAFKYTYRVLPQPCVVCGKGGKTNAHHFDYKYSLRIVWLCPHCHITLHQNGIMMDLARFIIDYALTQPHLEESNRIIRKRINFRINNPLGEAIPLWQG